MQFVGIAVVVMSLAVGTSQTYVNGATMAGFFTYTPNIFVAIVGLVITVVGAVVDPMIEAKLRSTNRV